MRRNDQGGWQRRKTKKTKFRKSRHLFRNIPGLTKGFGVVEAKD